MIFHICSGLHRKIDELLHEVRQLQAVERCAQCLEVLLLLHCKLVETAVVMRVVAAHSNNILVNCGYGSNFLQQKALQHSVEGSLP
jgi:hypothetical protein